MTYWVCVLSVLLFWCGANGATTPRRTSRGKGTAKVCYDWVSSYVCEWTSIRTQHKFSLTSWRIACKIRVLLRWDVTWLKSVLDICLHGARTFFTAHNYTFTNQTICYVYSTFIIAFRYKYFSPKCRPINQTQRAKGSIWVAILSC